MKLAIYAWTHELRTIFIIREFGLGLSGLFVGMEHPNKISTMWF